MKHKRNNRRPNNQAEQTAILKALHALETINLNNSTPRTVKVFTDSKITLLSLKNAKNRKYIIEEIRRKTTDLEKENWRIDFTWIKAHAGHSENELADKLAKEAIKHSEICYNRIPKSKIEIKEAEKTISKWQLQWDDIAKGRANKEYFSDIKERIKMNLRPSPNLTAMLPAHGKTKAYLHRFKIIQSPQCTVLYLQTRRPDNGPSRI